MPDNVEKLTKQMDHLGLTPFAAKKPAGFIGTPTTCVANIKKIDLMPNVPIYKYDVKIDIFYKKDDGEIVSHEISKELRSSEHNFRSKDQCRAVYLYVLEKHRDVFGTEQTCFYDQQASLYSTKDLGARNDFSIPTSVITPHASAHEIRMKIERVGCDFQATTNDIQATVHAVPRNANKTLLEALNAMISDIPNNRPNVFSIHGSNHFLFDPHEDGRFFTKWEGLGLSKAVKTLEGDGKKPQLYMVAEVKKTLFHVPGNSLADKLYYLDKQVEQFQPASAQAQKLLKQVKNVACYVSYSTTRTPDKDSPIVLVKGFGPAANSPQSRFEYDGRQVTIEEYFRAKYNVQINYPSMMTIKGQTGRRSGLFPADLLIVCEKQVVRNEQMMPNEQQAAIKSSAIPPAARRQQTESIIRSVGLDTHETIAGVLTIGKSFVSVPARVLEPPLIRTRDASSTVLPDSTWTVSKFVQPATINKWSVIFIEVQAPNFVEILLREMNKVGMTVSAPTVSNYDRYRNNLEEIFINAKNAGTSFLFFINRDNLNLHSHIKYFEKKYDILTQDNRSKVANAAKKTLENVINKVNIKNGGLNFVLSALQTEQYKYRLIVGFETSQRNSNAGTPIMIGYSANFLDHPQKFGGGFRFVKKNSDVFGPIVKETMKEMLQKMKENRGIAKEIFVYFNGVSEGQYSLINERYVQSIKDACIELSPTYRPHITVLAVSKSHNERFYKQDLSGRNAREQNIKPGTVIDKLIVSPVISEFYLTSHVTLQGTAKSPKFSVIYDTMKQKMDDIETFTYRLCFLHQIVYSPCSLPVPLVIADRFSKRGTMIYNQSGFVMPSNEKDVDEFIKKCNDQLTYSGKKLDGNRFNA
ncbi:unnamed protein product [Caenorhabditis bovis]|uniref:Piwi domain-containing protein n=1 Tax=Caenorhabditis bovis TaxID=2654633 RepID=A0A8S1F1Z2_9PELO|nr:unnamed protein product [Caenorhabditis bovis]